MNTYVGNLPLEAIEKEFTEIVEPDLLGSQARDLKVDKAEVPAEFDEDVEMPLEPLEEQGVIDDSVRMYLHEIGRVHLLTAGDERSLANQSEEGRRIRAIKAEWLKKQFTPPSAVETKKAVG